jgi:DNA mismatch repair protein PMS2
MHDRPTGEMVRCSKARSMFAMRACRKSIMIGKSLTKRQMAKVRLFLPTLSLEVEVELTESFG